mgnify:CR=1 FL=1
MVMAGGTGGHVYPALAVAKSLLRHDINVVWLGTRTGLEARVVPAAGIEVEWIEVKGVRGSGWVRKLWLPVMLGRALFQAYAAISRRRPVALLGMGGFVAGPGGLVAWLMRLPVLIHEANTRAGLTNRVLAPLSKSVMCGFPATVGLGGRVEWTGNPVGEEFLEFPPPADHYGQHADEVLRVLVIGGSQGARILNQVLPLAMAQLRPEQRPKLVHQCGRGRSAPLERHYQQLKMEAEVSEFIDDMAAVYRQADLVICRAGAMTVAEICAAGLAALLVPYPYAAGDHQRTNANYLASRGAAIALDESNLSAQHLAQTVSELQNDRGRLLSIGENARALARLDAAQRVTAQCLEVIGA